MANLKTLKPFKKGHKKLGGRKKGVRNKKSQSFSHLFMAAAARLGSDGKGEGGVVGFFMPLLRDNSRLAMGLFAAILRMRRNTHLRTWRKENLYEFCSPPS